MKAILVAVILLGIVPGIVASLILCHGAFLTYQLESNRDGKMVPGVTIKSHGKTLKFNDSLTVTICIVGGTVLYLVGFGLFLFGSIRPMTE